MDINTEALTHLRRVVAEHADSLDMYNFTEQCGTVRCAAGWFAGDSWARANTVIGEAFAANGSVLGWYAGPRMTLHRVFGTSVDVAALFFPENLDRQRPIAAAEVIAQIDLILAGKPIDGYPRYAPEASCS